MGIRAIFKLTWEDAVLRFATLAGVEVYPEQRAIVRCISVGGYLLAELCIIFGEYDTPQLVSARFCGHGLAVAAYLHVKEQEHRLLGEGIISKVIPNGGTLQCNYMKQDFVNQFV